jgi:hypothetical protein
MHGVENDVFEQILILVFRRLSPAVAVCRGKRRTRRNYPAAEAINGCSVAKVALLKLSMKLNKIN